MGSEEIQRTQEQIIEEFSGFNDWFEIYDHLIFLGKNLGSMDESLKTQENMINGCQSQVWVHAIHNENTVHFTADSDSLLVKGLISLLLRVYDNKHPKDVVNTDVSFLEAVGLSSHLSPSRSNGLVAIINQIKTLSKKFY